MSDLEIEQEFNDHMRLDAQSDLEEDLEQKARWNEIDDFYPRNEY